MMNFLLLVEVQVIIKSLQEETDGLFCCEAPEMFSGPVFVGGVVNRETELLHFGEMFLQVF